MKIRKSIAAVAAVIATVLTVGLVSGTGGAVVNADQPFGCC